MAGAEIPAGCGGGSIVNFMLHWLKRRPLLTGFVLLYTLVFGGIALAAGNAEFVFYTVAMVLYIGGVLWLDSRIHLSTLAFWLLAIWGLLHMAGGVVPIPESVMDGEKPVLYALRVAEWLPRYDQVVHTFGFFAATVTCAEAVRAAIKGRLSVGLAIGCALMGMGLGAVNEIVEFVAVLVMPETGVGGYINTGWDLVCNGIGAVVGAVLSWWRFGRTTTGVQTT